MGVFICKQPNGKYCRFSTVVDSVTDYNMTEDDYINLCVERAIENAKEILKYNTRPFQMVIDCFCPNNDSCEQFIEKLKKMGAETKLQPLNISQLKVLKITRIKNHFD